MRSWMSGLVAGIISVGWWPALPGFFFACLAGLLGLLSLRLVWPGARALSGLLLGFALAMAHGNALLHHRLADSCVRKALTLSGQVVSLPRHSEMPDGGPRQRFELRVEDLQPRRCAGPRRILLSYYGEQPIVPGERWRFVVLLRKPWGLANPASFNLQSWFAQTGIDALGSVSRDQAQRVGEAHPFDQGHHRARAKISERISALPLDADVRAILQAITVADKSGIDSRLWSLLQQFGVNHLLVISGLHIGLVAAGAYLLGGGLQRLAALRGFDYRGLPGICALIMAAAYAALAGFSLATQRALYMLSAFILADLLGRRSTASGNLLLAAVLVLGHQPLAALGSGFWLSFGAVAALCWLGQWQRGAGRARRVAGTHTFMALLMLPMGAWWFAGASLVAAPANLLLIPLLGIWVVPAALLATCCFLLDSSLELPLWQLAAWPLQQLLPLARGLEQLSPGWMYWDLQGGAEAIFLAVCAVLLLVIPAAQRLRLVALLFLLPLILPQDAREALPPGHTRVTVLDVGQGTAVLLQAGNRVLLYDTGGGDPVGSNMARAVILPLLRRRGISSLDTFIVSHPDRDHAAGTGDILRALPAARQLYGGVLGTMPQGRSCVAGESWSWPGGQTFQVLSPALEADLPSNNASCVLSVELEGYRLLLPGDIEAGRERQLVRYWGDGLYSDWLLAAHHGSKTSSSLTFLKIARPGVVVLSHGYANRFGHPHPGVLQRLRSAATAVTGTAENGALEFTIIPGQPVSVRAHRQELRRYWM